MQPCPTDRRSADRTATARRRTHLRLRELCDEVLASYRIATGRAPLSDDDRAAASSLLREVVPPLRG
jgi:hypothetical protein